ncbi:hypothetical protein L226DRAFT_260737 [Lentinus tigrinus ALCF2SS1-7]|uniref:uncharacterized protein n=1 Tax=Lentinus tigrinus ALCF2SS1-7 TaxID=1328758 RepID=UPI001165F6D8|nr:hypothetical protein L226DRAFT_260737 [Lentinus tigrinus ALCF2SS1-7]
MCCRPKLQQQSPQCIQVDDDPPGTSGRRTSMGTHRVPRQRPGPSIPRNIARDSGRRAQRASICAQDQLLVPTAWQSRMA